MWKEFSEHESMQALSKYGVFVLTPHRRKLLGTALLNLENDLIDLKTAKMHLRNQILFNKKIINALEKASNEEHAKNLINLSQLKEKLKKV